MDARELLDDALAIVDGNQAELARRVNRSETTVSRWVTGRNGIDFESALRLARLMNLPPREVVEACGLDPDLVPESPAQEPLSDQQDHFVTEIAAGMRAMREAGMVAELEHAKWAARFLFSVPATGARGGREARAIGGRGNGRQYDADRAKGTKNGRDDGLARWYRNGENVLARIARFVEPRTAAPAL